MPAANVAAFQSTVVFCSQRRNWWRDDRSPFSKNKNPAISCMAARTPEEGWRIDSPRVVESVGVLTAAEGSISRYECYVRVTIDISFSTDASYHYLLTR